MTERRDLDGSSSICVNPAYSPINYHWYRADPARRLIDEVHAVIDGMGVDQGIRDRLIGDFTARMLRRAPLLDLMRPGDLKINPESAMSDSGES
ncbi:hypothetical protein [Microbacterium sp. S1037]|uniref:hypothetical protein n=1 Tax=Microbacterium sp. S1037 TaxID=3398227 RepID=UPI003AB06A91